MSVVRELLTQLIEGHDFDAPARLLNVKPELACEILPGMPYSIATQVGHMQCWQRQWLDKIEGKPTKGYPTKAVDFPTVSEAEWKSLRATFLADLNLALEYAALPEPATATRLMKLALHNAYHFGQIKLLKRAQRASAR